MSDADPIKSVPTVPERRARVQACSGAYLPLSHSARPHDARPQGTVAWSEYLEAYAAYTILYGDDQSAERLHERGGFSFTELTQYLGRPPTTWKPWQS